MEITELRPGDRIMCCDVEHRVVKVVKHPAGIVVVTEDGAAITAAHLTENGFEVMGITFAGRNDEEVERAVDAVLATMERHNAEKAL